MPEKESDLIALLQSDDAKAVSAYADSLDDIDFLHNNKAGGSPLTLAWMAAFLGARKCLTHVVSRGANLEFFANEATVRRLGVLNRSTLLGLIEGGMSPNTEEVITLFMSDFETDLPKGGEVALLDNIIRGVADLELTASSANIARIRKSTAFNEAFPQFEEFAQRPKIDRPEAKALCEQTEEQIRNVAASCIEMIGQSLSLLTANLPVFEESVRRNFVGYRKNRSWLRDAATRVRQDLQGRLAPSLDLFEDDENLSIWIHLALARYPVRELLHGAKAAVQPLRNGLNFEAESKVALESAGFAVEITPLTGDQGADLIATRDGLKFVIQCKNYAGPVGNRAVQEVLGAKIFYGGDYAVVCAPADYTKSARSLAAASDVLLITPDLLPNLSKLRMLVE